jgi:hypothetical protein
LNLIGYKKDEWSFEKLEEEMNKKDNLILQSAEYHAGYLFNPKFLVGEFEKFDEDEPDFSPEAFKTIGYHSGIW